MPVHGDHTAAGFLGRAVAQLDDAADLAGWTDHHVPGQVRNLTGPQPGLGRQQHDHAVAQGIADATGVHQEISNIR